MNHMNLYLQMEQMSQMAYKRPVTFRTLLNHINDCIKEQHGPKIIILETKSRTYFIDHSMPEVDHKYAILWRDCIISRDEFLGIFDFSSNNRIHISASAFITHQPESFSIDETLTSELVFDHAGYMLGSFLRAMKTKLSAN